MKELYSSRGIVVHKENYSEADQFVQFITQDWGLITVHARYSRKSLKRFVGGLDLFCHSEISIRGLPKETPHLNELSVINSFLGLRQDFERIAHAGKILEWTRKLSETANATSQLYRLVGQTLALMEKENSIQNLELLSFIFRVKLFELIGLQPKTDSCVSCDEIQSEKWCFDIAAGGVLCKNCFSKNLLQEYLLIDENLKAFFTWAEHLKFTTDWNQQKIITNTSLLLKITHHFGSYHGQVLLPL